MHAFARALMPDISGHISGAASNPVFIDGREKPFIID
jgi:hypothetical protein